MLKVGLLLPANGCVAWVEHLVREIAATSVAGIVLIGIAERRGAGHRRGGLLVALVHRARPRWRPHPPGRLRHG